MALDKCMVLFLPNIHFCRNDGKDTAPEISNAEYLCLTLDTSIICHSGTCSLSGCVGIGSLWCGPNYHPARLRVCTPDFNLLRYSWWVETSGYCT